MEEDLKNFPFSECDRIGIGGGCPDCRIARNYFCPFIEEDNPLYEENMMKRIEARLTNKKYIDF
jgi:hypothetical protein